MVSIAIDGPAGAGKSSICTRLAQELHYLHIDTGALYRAVGLFVLRQNKNPADPTDVLPLLPHIHIDLRFEKGEQRILLNGEDVSEAIRLPEASAAASAVSALPEVRAYLLEQASGNSSEIARISALSNEELRKEDTGSHVFLQLYGKVLDAMEDFHIILQAQ